MTREELFEKYSYLIPYVARMFTRYAKDYDDLHQEIALALWLATARYRECETAFGSFAYHRLRGAAIDWIRRHAALTRSQYAHLREFNELTDRLGREPTEAEYCAETGHTPGTYWAITNYRGAQSPLSIEWEPEARDSTGDRREPLRRRLPDTRRSSVEAIEAALEAGDDIAYWRARLATVLPKLPKRLAYILEEKLAGRTCQEIGTELGVSESRISQLMTSIPRHIASIERGQIPTRPREGHTPDDALQRFKILEGEEPGLSVAELAARLGVPRERVAGFRLYARGKTRAIPRAERLALVLDRLRTDPEIGIAEIALAINGSRGTAYDTLIEARAILAAERRRRVKADSHPEFTIYDSDVWVQREKPFDGGLYTRAARILFPSPQMHQSQLRTGKFDALARWVFERPPLGDRRFGITYGGHERPQGKE